ncbi:hypothetical protein TYRP_014011 [Tyrophagus putrescentiae]|nr:hypothetical protein TYRP_014011 [Tyrophagus putrescentiae]
MALSQLLEEDVEGQLRRVQAHFCVMSPHDTAISGQRVNRPFDGHYLPVNGGHIVVLVLCETFGEWGASCGVFRRFVGGSDCEPPSNVWQL